MIVSSVLPYERRLNEYLAAVRPVDRSFASVAQRRLDSLTKPQGSLGALEDVALSIAVIQGVEKPSVDERCIHLYAADHGVVAKGVSAFPQDVTWQMIANIVSGGAAINQIASAADASIELFDVGVAADVTRFDGVVDNKIAYGTMDFSEGPAMTREQACNAVCVGIENVLRASARGVTLVGTGELGIGNTTAAAALAAAFLGVAPEVVVGPGTGIGESSVRHKAAVISKALEVNDVGSLDAIGVLAAVGGLELAAMSGTIIGAALAGVTVVCDGFISTASALAASRICPVCTDYMMPSHLSPEPGHAVVLEAIGLNPILRFDMRLGEGTGAALAFSIIDAACRMMSGMSTFTEAGVSGADQ